MIVYDKERRQKGKDNMLELEDGIKHIDQLKVNVVINLGGLMGKKLDQDITKAFQRAKFSKGLMKSLDNVDTDNIALNEFEMFCCYVKSVGDFGHINFTTFQKFLQSFQKACMTKGLSEIKLQYLIQYLLGISNFMSHHHYNPNSMIFFCEVINI